MPGCIKTIPQCPLVIRMNDYCKPSIIRLSFRFGFSYLNPISRGIHDFPVNITTNMNRICFHRVFPGIGKGSFYSFPATATRIKCRIFYIISKDDSLIYNDRTFCIKRISSAFKCYNSRSYRYIGWLNHKIRAYVLLQREQPHTRFLHHLYTAFLFSIHRIYCPA